jgi:hypothetical protein
LHPFREEVEFLLHGGGIHGNAGQISPHQGRDHDKGLPDRNLPIGKASEGGQRIDSGPFQRDRFPPGFGVAGHRNAGNAQEQHHDKKDQEGFKYAAQHSSAPPVVAYEKAKNYIRITGFWGKKRTNRNKYFGKLDEFHPGY